MATPKLRHGLALVGVVALSCFSATALVPPPRPHASPSARPQRAGASSSLRFGTRTVLAAATVPAAEVDAKATAPPFSVSSTGITSQVTFSGCGGLYCYFFGVAGYADYCTMMDCGDSCVAFGCGGDDDYSYGYGSYDYGSYDYGGNHSGNYGGNYGT